MATLNEIVYNIKNIATAGSSNSESDISNRQIKAWVHYYRAEILKEMSANGKKLSYLCYQSVNPVQSSDVYWNNSDWVTYVELKTSSTREMIVAADRTFIEASIDAGSAAIVNYEDFYGRDFYNDFQGRSENGDYGHLKFYVPSLLHINGNGVSSLRIREGQGDYKNNHGTIDIPFVSKDEYANKKHNRFSSKSPAAYLQKYSDGREVLTIGRLRSYFINPTGSPVVPIQYVVYSDLLLSNPTEAPNWNDDMFYPLPDDLIPELNKKIFTMEMSLTLQGRADKVSDNADTTKFNQSQAQTQVRK